MQGKGALPGAARLCVRAVTRRAPKEKTWRARLWCNLKPRNLPWCATVLLAALFLSGHGGVLHEFGVFLGTLNGVAAEAAASVPEASKPAINGSEQFLMGGDEVLSTSSLLLRPHRVRTGSAKGLLLDAALGGVTGPVQRECWKHKFRRSALWNIQGLAAGKEPAKNAQKAQAA